MYHCHINPVPKTNRVWVTKCVYNYVWGCVEIFPELKGFRNNRFSKNYTKYMLSDQSKNLLCHIWLWFFYFKFHSKLLAFKSAKFSILEFQAFNLLNTPIYLAAVSTHQSALNSWTHNRLFLRFRRLPEQTRVNWLMQIYYYGNFGHFNPWAMVSNARRKEHWVAILLLLINTWNAQEVRATRFESLAIIKKETQYCEGPFREYFAYCCY